MSLPPFPIGAAPDSFEMQQWYLALQAQLGGATGTIPWDNVSKTGSDLSDLAARAHNNLQSIQGGSTGLYYHLETAIKGSLTHDFGSIAAGATATQTVAVTGAAVDNAVFVSPSTQLEDGLVIYGFVSSANTVTIVAQNTIGSPIDPASRTYYIMVLDN